MARANAEKKTQEAQDEALKQERHAMAVQSAAPGVAGNEIIDGKGSAEKAEAEKDDE